MKELLALNAFMFGSLLWYFWDVPVGAEIRPMAFAGFYYVIAFTMALVGSGNALALAKQTGIRVVVLKIALAICPVLLSASVIRLIAALRGFTLAP